MATRIYIVEAKAARDAAGKTNSPRLVECNHPSHALRHVASDTLTVKVASQRELVDLLRKGVNVEAVKPEQTELPTS